MKPKRIKLKDWNEVADYYAKHLKPVGFTPKGHPIYSGLEVAKLNIEYPDDKCHLTT